MIYKKKISVGAFAKKDVDYKNGDVVIVANEGKQVPSSFDPEKTNDVFLVKLPNGEEKNINFNQTTMNGLIDAYGADSKLWIGKELKVHIITQNVAGKFVKVTYLSHPKAELTENGFILPTANKVAGTDEDYPENDLVEGPF